MLENKGDAHHQLEAESNLTSSPPRNPGAGRTKIDAQDAYRLCFQRFLIHWKDNFITFPCHRFHLKIPSESTGNVETSQHPESARVLRHHLLARWAVYHVGVH